jgi:hypothetical protein
MFVEESVKNRYDDIQNELLLRKFFLYALCDKMVNNLFVFVRNEIFGLIDILARNSRNEVCKIKRKIIPIFFLAVIFFRFVFYLSFIVLLDRLKEENSFSSLFQCSEKSLTDFFSMNKVLSSFLPL